MKRIFAALSALLALTVTAIPQEDKLSPSLRSLVEAERAFARMSVEKGVRESFLAFFADDGINFQPYPTKTREAFLSRPAPAQLPPITLDWEPVWADVSAAGDLGYTTGPYTLTDHSPEKRPTRYGYFFSVWRKQRDGNWKVVLDLGTTNPEPTSPLPPFHSPHRSRPARAVRKLSRDEGRAALTNLERDFQREARARGYTKTFLNYLTPESRLYRQQMLPLVGSDIIRPFLEQKEISMTWEPLYADIAQSNDLGYVYGSYELRDNPAQGSVIEKGYFARVWNRGADGKWRVALDVTSPLPPKIKITAGA